MPDSAFARRNVPREGGGTVSFARRERPHLILGADGFTPIALSSSVTMDGGGDHSWTQIQKISDQPRRQQQQQQQQHRPQQAVAKKDERAGRLPAESAGRDARSSARTAAAAVDMGPYLRARGGAGADLGSEPFSCDGGNVMQLSTSPSGSPCSSGGSSIRGGPADTAASPSCATAEISRTGLEGLIGFHAPGASAKHLSFTADNFALNLTVASGPTAVEERAQTQIELRSESDTDSRRFCALFSACSNRTAARLIYRCQERSGLGGGGPPACSGYCRHLHYRVVVTYTLGGSPVRVTKAVDACELTSVQPACAKARCDDRTVRECDATKRVEVVGTELWGSIRPSCAGTAC
eukprot:SAG11_NODE_82_length_17639_cov_6.427594_2_plen_352_part_00